VATFTATFRLTRSSTRTTQTSRKVRSREQVKRSTTSVGLLLTKEQIMTFMGLGVPRKVSRTGSDSLRSISSKLRVIKTLRGIRLSMRSSKSEKHIRRDKGQMREVKSGIRSLMTRRRATGSLQTKNTTTTISGITQTIRRRKTQTPSRTQTSTHLRGSGTGLRLTKSVAMRGPRSLVSTMRVNRATFMKKTGASIRRTSNTTGRLSSSALKHSKSKISRINLSWISRSSKELSSGLTARRMNR